MVLAIFIKDFKTNLEDLALLIMKNDKEAINNTGLFRIQTLNSEQYSNDEREKSFVRLFKSVIRRAKSSNPHLVKFLLAVDPIKSIIEKDFINMFTRMDGVLSLRKLLKKTIMVFSVTQTKYCLLKNFSILFVILQTKNTKNMKKIIQMNILTSILLCNVANADSTSSIDITAKIDPGCFLEADDINFGVFSMPLNDQSSSSNMRVHCSKGANLNIKISYDNNISETGSNGYSFVDKGISTEHEKAQNFHIYKDGNFIGGILCQYDSSFNFIDNNHKLMNSTSGLYDLYGIQVGSTTGYPDVHICSGNTLNVATFNQSAGQSFATNGFLIGVSKGENIKFTLENPKNSLIWSINNGYEAIATGQSQIIPMKANIKRAENPTHRMSPDTYLSTLTVVLTY